MNNAASQGETQEASNMAGAKMPNSPAPLVDGPNAAMRGIESKAQSRAEHAAQSALGQRRSQTNVHQAAADLKAKQSSFGVDTQRKAPTQRSATKNSRYSRHSSGQLRGERDGGQDHSRNRVTPRHSNIKQASVPSNQELVLQNSKGTIGVRIKSAKRSEVGSKQFTTQDEKFVDKSFQGWDIKKQDVDTARKEEDEIEYNNERQLADSALQSDTQNPLNKFYEQYGAQFGIRQSNESRNSAQTQEMAGLQVQDQIHDVINIQDEVQQRQIQVIREAEEQLNKVSQQRGDEQDEGLGGPPGQNMASTGEALLDGYQHEGLMPQRMSLPANSSSQFLPGAQQSQLGGIHVVESITDGVGGIKLQPQRGSPTLDEQAHAVKIINYFGKEL